MNQPSLFSLMPKESIPNDIEVFNALETAYALYWRNMTEIQPETTGMSFPLRLPDGRVLDVRMHIRESKS
jgi:hypothetical protein